MWPYSPLFRPWQVPPPQPWNQQPLQRAQPPLQWPQQLVVVQQLLVVQQPVVVQYCNICNKYGHTSRQCFINKNAQKQQPQRQQNTPSPPPPQQSQPQLPRRTQPDGSCSGKN